MSKMEIDHIELRGARVHNLKNLDVDLPLRKLVCLAGPSGSGKTSLAFHTLLMESKRRFINSFPNSMKFFAEKPSPVDVDRIFPVLPVLGLPQINPVVGSRTVVSDVMRLTDSFQNLFYLTAVEMCPTHHCELVETPVSSQVEKILLKHVNVTCHIVSTPVICRKIFGEDFIPVRSYSPQRGTFESYSMKDPFWEVLRFKSDKLETLDKKWNELNLKFHHNDFLLWIPGQDNLVELKIKSERSCPECGFISHLQHSVSAFSPYSALGACTECSGYGAKLVYDEKKIMDLSQTINEGALKLLNYGPFQYDYEQLLKILKKRKISLDVPLNKLPKDFFSLLENGEGKYTGYNGLKKYLENKRYKPSVRIYIRNLQKEIPCTSCACSRVSSRVHHYYIKIGEKFINLPKLMSLSILESYKFFSDINDRNADQASRLLGDIKERLQLAMNLGLSHLSLLRKAKTLSAGEYQRLLLIKYLAFKGTDSLFVLDEPGLGLSTKELVELEKGLRKLVGQGNTVIIIDHSDFMQSQSDVLIVMGPGSGKDGGEILFQGMPTEYFKFKSKENWEITKNFPKKYELIEVRGPKVYGKIFPDFKIPLNEVVWVTGDSGIGKTASIVKVMANHLHKKIYSKLIDEVDYSFDSMKMKTILEDVIVISSDLNRFTSRSTVGTVTEFSSVIRKHFLKLPISKSMGLKEGHFSSNSELGMCAKCEGKGTIIIEMQYLEDIVLECDDCKGLRIKPLYANISDGVITVAQAYSLPLSQVLGMIVLTPKFRRIWEYLKILNLDYLSLDRTLNSLSGGEKQRIFLLSKLVKSIQNSLIVFENLSFGLSEKELKMMGLFLQDLTQLNNTLIVIDSSPYFRHLATSELVFTESKATLTKLN